MFSEIFRSNLKGLAARLLISLLISGSLVTWMQFFRARRNQQPWMELCDHPRAGWYRIPDLFPVMLTLLWLSQFMIARFVPERAARSESLGTTLLLSQLIISGGLTLMLLILLVGGHRPPVEFGLKWHPVGDQIRDGVRGFLLSALPMGATMLLTSPLRNPDTQNALLRSMTDSSNPVDLLLICLIATVAAPLSEELMFRVILQGWLSSLVRPGLAMTLVVLAFAAIHGPADGIALLPLAAVLGYVFHRRHSYLSVVVIHFLFNATMLVLQILIQTKNHP